MILPTVCKSWLELLTTITLENQYQTPFPIEKQTIKKKKEKRREKKKGKGDTNPIWPELHYSSSCLGASLISSPPSSWIRTNKIHPISKPTVRKMTTIPIQIEDNNDLHIWSPQSQVITKKLHYQSAVLVRLLSQGIQLSNGFIKSLVKTVENHQITLEQWTNPNSSYQYIFKVQRSNINDYKDPSFTMELLSGSLMSMKYKFISTSICI